MTNKLITIETVVANTLEKVWNAYTSPEDVIHWNAASEDWHTPKAEVDLRVGGKFVYTMAAKDGSMSFDFTGTYEEVVPLQLLDIKLEDGRLMRVTFTEEESTIRVQVEFEIENENPEELQRAGWQAILNRFGSYANAK